MSLGRFGLFRMAALLGAIGFTFMLMAAYQLGPIAPASRMTQMLGLQSAAIEPVDYTAALVYMIERRRMEDIPHSLGEAQRNIPWRRQWPIILFHTGDYDAEDSRNEFFSAIRENEWSHDVYHQLRNRIEFVKLNFKWPPGVPENKSIYKPQVSEEKWPGMSLGLRRFPHLYGSASRIPTHVQILRTTDLFPSTNRKFDVLLAIGHRLLHHETIMFRPHSPDTSKQARICVQQNYARRGIRRPGNVESYRPIRSCASGG
jgi:hypothetical protein